MTGWPDRPVIYEVNTAVWLDELSRGVGRRLTLADVPGARLGRGHPGHRAGRLVPQTAGRRGRPPGAGREWRLIDVAGWPDNQSCRNLLACSGRVMAPGGTWWWSTCPWQSHLLALR
jgi:hypothetical protein